MSKSKKVTMDRHEFWCLRSAHEELAVRAGDVRQIIECAKVRINDICTSVTNSGRPNQLCYEEDNKSMVEALGLLKKACEAEYQIKKAKRELPL